ncbi:MAG: hypothetical protein HF978_00100 [Desulfobacteraceae bacterium]|nr:hypothetical protein [Desulfobacteraceae bacterium]MBC2753936.1 hypothetical protein [Desulfobacteraceae bacterium]
MDHPIRKDYSFLQRFKKKKDLFFIPFITLMTITTALAFSLPVFYESVTTILVEESNIPESIVDESITGFINQRLETITQRIMSRTKLWEIVEQHGLYKDSREKLSRQELVDTIKDRIELNTITSDLFQAGSGSPLSIAISFSLSFEDNDPHMAQRITSELANLYIQENEAKIEKIIEDSTGFLDRERKRLEEKLLNTESRIAEFKKRHIYELPEQLQENIKLVTDLEDEIEQLSIELKSLLIKQSEVKGTLRQTKPYSSMITPTGEKVMGPEEMLDALRLEYLSKRATLSPHHPDLISIDRQLKEFEKVVSRKAQEKNIEKHLENLKSDFLGKSGSLSDQHPDMVALKRQIDVAQQELNKLSQSDGETAHLTAREPDNPAYIELETNLKTLAVDIQATEQKTARQKDRLSIYQERINRTSGVEKAYLLMTREYEHLKGSHEELLSKIKEARDAREVEKSQQGGKFVIIDAANFPEKISKPNVLLIIFLGLIISFSVSMGIIYLSEYLDASVKSKDDLTAVTSRPVLGSIPYLTNSQDEMKHLRRKTLDIVVLFLILSGAVWCVYQYYTKYYLPLPL